MPNINRLALATSFLTLNVVLLIFLITLHITQRNTPRRPTIAVMITEICSMISGIILSVLLLTWEMDCFYTAPLLHKMAMPPYSLQIWFLTILNCTRFSNLISDTIIKIIYSSLIIIIPLCIWAATEVDTVCENNYNRITHNPRSWITLNSILLLFMMIDVYVMYKVNTIVPKKVSLTTKCLCMSLLVVSVMAMLWMIWTDVGVLWQHSVDYNAFFAVHAFFFGLEIFLPRCFIWWHINKNLKWSEVVIVTAITDSSRKGSMRYV
jgi:hypothetical protein